MRAVLTAAGSDIRRRKLQTFVIAFVILLSSGAATLALSLLVESDAPYAHAFAQAKGAHLIVTYSGDRVSASRLARTASARDVTASAGPWPEVVASYTAASHPLPDSTFRTCASWGSRPRSARTRMPGWLPAK